MSSDAPLVRPTEYVRNLKGGQSCAIFVGAMAKGRDDFAEGIADEKIAVSQFPLSASVACSKFCHAAEEVWDVL